MEEPKIERLRELIKSISYSGIPEPSLSRFFFGAKNYETLFRNKFFECNLVAIIPRIYSTRVFSKARIPGFGGSLFNFKSAALLFKVINDYCAVRYFSIESYSQSHLRITPKSLEEEAETYARDIAITCRKVAVVDSPKRGFKPAELLVYYPADTPAAFESKRVELSGAAILASRP